MNDGLQLFIVMILVLLLISVVLQQKGDDF